MNSQDKDLRKKVKKLYNQISSDLYKNIPDIQIGSEKYNSTLLLGSLTELNLGKQLLYGEYGGGKTTSAEYLNSLYYGLPLELIKKSAIRADPQKTEEKMTARPDYAHLQSGEEKVIWQDFVTVPGKIIDEFNRLPEPNQSVVLNGVDRGEWAYLNDFVITGPQAFFATCNYADRGNNDLIPPLLDRFDVATESKFPGSYKAVEISKDYYNSKAKKLENREKYKEALEVLRSGKDYNEIINLLEDKVAIPHRRHLRSNGYDVLDPDELETIRDQISNIGVETDADIYFTMLISEMNVSPKYGQKRSVDPVHESDGNWFGNAFKGSGSRRGEKSIMRYSKSLAWLLGEDKVNVEHMATVAPYCLWHKLDYTDNVIGAFKENTRADPLNLHITKKLVSSGGGADSGWRSVLKKFDESKDNYHRIHNHIVKGEFAEAKKAAKDRYMGGKGHPIFKEIMDELESEE